jgi:hypothetical protein
VRLRVREIVSQRPFFVNILGASPTLPRAFSPHPHAGTDTKYGGVSKRGFHPLFTLKGRRAGIDNIGVGRQKPPNKKPTRVYPPVGWDIIFYAIKRKIF